MNRIGKNKSSWTDTRPITQYGHKPEIANCQKCGCSWLEQIQVQRYPKLHNVTLGQKVQAAEESAFFLFRCVKCSEVYEPNIQAGMHDSMRRYYDDFLDELEESPSVVEDTPLPPPEEL